MSTVPRHCQGRAEEDAPGWPVYRVFLIACDYSSESNHAMLPTLPATSNVSIVRLRRRNGHASLACPVTARAQDPRL